MRTARARGRRHAAVKAAQETHCRLRRADACRGRRLVLLGLRANHEGISSGVVS
jgi:hypothetical protein